MKQQIVTLLMAGLLVMGAAPGWAQEPPVPADTPAAAAVEKPNSIPAPDVNINVAPPPAAAPNVDVHVQAPAAPPSTVIVEKGGPSTKSTNTSRTETTTVVAAESGLNPWLIAGLAVGLLVLILFVASAFSDGKPRNTTITTIR